MFTLAQFSEVILSEKLSFFGDKKSLISLKSIIFHVRSKSIQLTKVFTLFVIKVEATISEKGS
jgi:hypothetical protein